VFLDDAVSVGILIARLGQDSLGAFRIISVLLGVFSFLVGAVAGLSRRNKAVQRLYLSVERFGQSLSVDTDVDGFSYSLVSQRAVEGLAHHVGGAGLLIEVNVEVA